MNPLSIPVFAQGLSDWLFYVPHHVPFPVGCQIGQFQPISATFLLPNKTLSKTTPPTNIIITTTIDHP
jgi:hypothetical protein